MQDKKVADKWKLDENTLDETSSKSINCGVKDLENLVVDGLRDSSQVQIAGIVCCAHIIINIWVEKRKELPTLRWTVEI